MQITGQTERCLMLGSLMLLLLGCGLAEQKAHADPQATKAAERPANRLAKETSPYLLLHAHNPVDWYPWGSDAFAKAKRENKLIFLSVGYSTCYWCHVMEREAFSNAEIAKFMNEHFVCIKVDREERPDIDEVYMSALQVYYQLTRVPSAGGWPLSMFLTPDLQPLAGGTYFPAEDQEDRTGFKSILKTIQTAWTERPDELLDTAATLTRAVQSTLRQRPVLTPVQLEQSVVQQAVEELQSGFDEEHGGFDFNPAQPQRPKFPTPVRLAFLQAYATQQNNRELQRQILLTLDHMADGGLHDQLGGGFHRYSTDRAWHVPHFEKMLYDNAQLADVYLTAYEQTKQPRYRAIAERTLQFVLRELTDKQGGFYSALDAETDGVEGKYYVWSREEIQQAASEEEVRLLALHHGLDADPNFEESYVLEAVRAPAKLALQLQVPVEEIEARLSTAQAALFKARQQRPALLRDDKILVSWNGLMIRALARAGQVLQHEEYLHAAERAAVFIMREVRDADGDLLHSYCSGEAKLAAFADDYAQFIAGLLAIYEATGDDKWLTAASRLQARQDELFWDDRGQGYFYASTSHEQPIIRTQQTTDLIMPSANSASARNLLQLASKTQRPELRERAAALLRSGTPRLNESPRSTSTLAWALLEYLAATPMAIEESEAPPEATPAEPESTPAAPPATETDDQSALDTSTENEIALVGAEEPAEQAPPVAPKAEKKPQHVTGYVYLPVDRLQPGKSCEVLIRLEILEGWHINPNPPPDEFTPPTDITLKAEHDIELVDLVYPKPKSKEVPGLKKTLLYYEGRTLVRGVLEVPAAAGGTEVSLEFKVKYQACNDKTCLTPKSFSIKVPVEVARPGEPVQSINAKLFPKAPAR